MPRFREIPPDCMDAIRWEAARLARRLPWRAERDDLEQEGALAVWAALLAGKPAKQEYARMVARNAMVSMSRRAASWSRLDAAAGLELGEIVADRRPDVDAILDVREAVAALKLAALTSTYGHLDASPAELAGGLGITRQAAASRLHHARRRVREALGDGYAHMAHPPIIKYSKWVTADARRRAERKRKGKA